MLPIQQIPNYIRAYWRLREYKASKVTLPGIRRWVKQFPSEHRADLIRLAANLRFISERDVIRSLIQLNGQILRALSADGVLLDSVIYITTDKPGSSSEIMLGLLRDHGNLERQKATFLHSSNGIGIRETTAALDVYAIIYVDDFAGTGKQFVRSRRAVARFARGSFSEWLLLPCICEEALSRVKNLGVEPRAGLIHRCSERPLREECHFLTQEERERLVDLSTERLGRPKVSLGFDGLATNVILYRNAPNTTPLIFRGNLGQKPLHGVVPRFDDLEIPDPYLLRSQ